jgi:hypothetical protein
MRAIDHKLLDLPEIRKKLRLIHVAQKDADYATADDIRKELLSLDPGMKIAQNRDRVSLWHFPDPPFTGAYSMCNFGEFIANSLEEE